MFDKNNSQYYMLINKKTFFKIIRTHKYAIEKRTGLLSMWKNGPIPK